MIFVESVDVDRAWEVYYQLADRRNQPGLTLDELRQVIDAALVGVVPAEERTSMTIVRDEVRYDPPLVERMYHTPWVEVEEHQ